VGVSDESYSASDRAMARKRRQAKNLLCVVRSFGVLWAFNNGRWSKIRAPVTVPRQVALTHSCWKPHRQFF